ncbi:thioesterase domain-containing protein [Streptomyces sp. NPDC050264]|uniref:thioesterase II family protein n=1 Tax=Streptomyces sp. NPDC050264 TaxID=3155038 RepID=UPI00342F4003
MHSAARWTAVLRPAVRRARRLVVFPHAGGAPRRYTGLVAELPGDVEVIGVTLPGREHRSGLPPRTSVREAVGEIAGELAVLEPLPSVFYGHSMGALLAVASAHETPGRCHGLVASCSPPGRTARPGGGRAASSRELAAVFAAHRLPGDALDNGALTAAQRVLAHDLRLAYGLSAAVEALCLSVPLTAVAGRSDHLVAPELLPGWRQFTSGQFRSHLTEGGHFLPFTPYGGEAVRAELRTALAAARSTRTPAAGSAAPVRPRATAGAAPGARPARRPR